MDSRTNLEIRTDCWASQVLFDGSRATGIEYQRGIGPGRETITANREVILSAGAIDTPKLLMLSGIGPAEHLREFGVDVRVDAPGVGANLDDHVTESTQWWEIGLFHRTEQGLDRPDLMMHYGSVPFDLNTVRHGYPTTDNGFCLTPNVTRGKSRGTVRLRTRDFRDRARVDPKYFTDPDGHDMRVMIEGARLARRIAEQPVLKEWVAAELAPGPDAVTDDDLADYMMKTHNTVYHPACTAKMGVDTDPLAVLDPQLRVRGVQNLRVADGSAMPFLPAINPNITTMMIGEKCSDLLKAAHGG
jgi:choline oxidase